MSVNYNFNGKVALITGSSSGIGAAIAILLSKSGAQVVLTGRNAEKLQSVVNQCSVVSPNNLKPLKVLADIAVEEDIQRLVNTVIDSFGKLDILVNNAGFVVSAQITDPDYIEKYKNTMNTNLNSVVYLTHICVKYLEKTKGNIINISGIASIITSPKSSHYCMSKTAIDMFTKCIAVELGPKGIRVNSVSPGCVRTDILSTSGRDSELINSFWDSVGPKYPVGRCGEGVDIANAVLYLASEQASFITGSVLLADGGHTSGNVKLR